MADQTLAKYLNERTILSLLRVEREASRTEIARRLSVTPATITRLVGGLIERGLVRDIPQKPNQPGSNRNPGRPTTNVALNPKGAYFLGIELAVGLIRFAVIDLAASVAHRSEKAVPEQASPERAAREISSYVEALQIRRAYRDRLKGIGVAAPGLVLSNGVIVNLPIVGWKNIDFLNLLSRRINVPICIENDANAAAFGFLYSEPRIPNACALFVKLDRGCGGAVVVDGRLLKGANGTASEFGHLRLSESGPLCDCGGRGCFESRIGLSAIAKRYYQVESPDEDQLANILQDLSSASAKNDSHAKATVASVLHWLALGLTSLVNLYNPGAIVIGGPTCRLLEQAMDQLAKRVREQIVPGIPMPSIALSTLGLYECAIGAAAIAHHHAFDISGVVPTRFSDAASGVRP